MDMGSTVWAVCRATRRTITAGGSFRFDYFYDSIPGFCITPCCRRVIVDLSLAAGARIPEWDFSEPLVRQQHAHQAGGRRIRRTLGVRSLKRQRKISPGHPQIVSNGSMTQSRVGMGSIQNRCPAVGAALMQNESYLYDEVATSPSGRTTMRD